MDSRHAVSPRARKGSLRVVERALWVVAALGLGWYVFSQVEGELYQRREEARLEELLANRARSAGAPAVTSEPLEEQVGQAKRLRELPGEEEPAPSAPAPPPGGAIGKIAIPRLGLSVVVSAGTDKRTLRRAVGHIPGTALPGEPGNVGLAGHRDRYFRPLKDVRAGDEIAFTTPDGTFHYRVQWAEVVDPSAVHVLDDTAEPALTLVTCYPFYYVGPAPRRFVVRARQVRQESAAAPAAAR